MMTAVSVRRANRNNLPVATSSPSRWVVIASRVVNPDRLDVMLRGEHDGTLDGAKRHAEQLARLVADRCASPACADVLTLDGEPAFSFACPAGGAR